MWAKAIDGTFNPGTTDATNKFWQKLVDGQISQKDQPTYWAQVNTGSMQPSMTLQLDRFYTDIIGVTLYPRDDALGSLRNSSNISVYLSPTSAFSSDPNKVICIQGLAYLVERSPAFIPCAAAASVGILYVTIFRVLASTAYFDLQEVQIQRAAGELLKGSHAPMRVHAHAPKS